MPDPRRPTRHRDAWTDADVALLRERYRADGPRALAAEMGRSRAAVAMKAHHLGLARPPKRADAAHLAEVARLNAEGTSDAGIARSLGSPLATINAHRRKLGLPVVGKPGRPARKSVAEATADAHA